MVFRCAIISLRWNSGLSSFDESVEVAEADLHPWYACCGTMADTTPTGRTNTVRRNAQYLKKAAFQLLQSLLLFQARWSLPFSLHLCWHLHWQSLELASHLSAYTLLNFNEETVSM